MTLSVEKLTKQVYGVYSNLKCVGYIQQIDDSKFGVYRYNPNHSLLNQPKSKPIRKDTLTKLRNSIDTIKWSK